MASLIDPRCAVPLFLMDNEKIASECGKISGYVIAFIITIIILIIGIFYYFSYMHNNSSLKNKIIYFSVIFLILILIWMGLPLLNGWINKRRWMGYNEQIKSYMNNGMNKEEAIKKMQDIYQYSMQADAIENAGLNISGALYSGLFNMNKKN